MPAAEIAVRIAEMNTSRERGTPGEDSKRGLFGERGDDSNNCLSAETGQVLLYPEELAYGPLACGPSGDVPGAAGLPVAFRISSRKEQAPSPLQRRVRNWRAG